MRQYQYLIIGSGLAGDAAARGIRELDPTGIPNRFFLTSIFV
jgi:succinate dehydrogenase/fumarate reductase flavoprotein subunit